MGNPVWNPFCAELPVAGSARMAAFMFEKSNHKGEDEANRAPNNLKRCVLCQPQKSIGEANCPSVICPLCVP
jgi:hypothetical protein